eukprot:scaffold1784_cov196-Alexandrium_tamarense.AAC.10
MEFEWPILNFEGTGKEVEVSGKGEVSGKMASRSSGNVSIIGYLDYRIFTVTVLDTNAKSSSSLMKSTVHGVSADETNDTAASTAFNNEEVGQ